MEYNREAKNVGTKKKWKGRDPEVNQDRDEKIVWKKIDRIVY
jgi:hypothetical protein